MQTLSRCAYAQASYDENTQNHELYAETKAKLELTVNTLLQKAKQCLSDAEFIGVNAIYSEDKNISLCYYKGRIFVGFEDRNTKEISLNDTSNAFVNMPSATPRQLCERMENAINGAAKGKPNLMSEQVAAKWKPLTPILDKIIEYEKAFEKLPEAKQQALIHQGIKDIHINRIVDGNPPIAKEKSICNTSLNERFEMAKNLASKQEKNKDKVKSLGKEQINR